MTQDFSNPQPPAEQSAGPSLEKLQSLNAIGTISYALHLIVAIGALVPGGQFGPLLLVVALGIDLVKRSDAQGTWHASHFIWRIGTVFTAGLLYLLTAPLWLLLVVPGWFAWLAVSVWFLYRIVKGFVAMNKGQAMGMSP